MEVTFKHSGQDYPVNIIKRGDDFVVDIENKSYTLQAVELKPGYILVQTHGSKFKAIVSSEAETRYVFWGGHVYRLNKVEGSKMASSIAEAVSNEVTSPISGKIVKVSVADGDEVNGGQDLLIIEAMKMEYRVKAPYAGKVAKVHYTEGDQVEIGELLVVMEEPEGGCEDAGD